MSYLAKNYNRKKISFKYGKGSYLYSTDKKKYLDFVQGIAVNSLGHAHPKLVKTIKYKANTFVMFLNTDKSVHGVTPRTNAKMDRLSINIIAETNSKQDKLFRLHEHV